jgi:hypothetical protein
VIEIKADTQKVTAALERLADGATPAGIKTTLMKIGQELVESTHARFVSKTSPDGTRWDANAPATQKLKGRDNPLVETGGGRGTLVIRWKVKLKTRLPVS